MALVAWLRRLVVGTALALPLLAGGNGIAAPKPAAEYDIPFAKPNDDVAARRRAVIIYNACMLDSWLVNAIADGRIASDAEPHEAELSILLAKAYLYLYDDTGAPRRSDDAGQACHHAPDDRLRPGNVALASPSLALWAVTVSDCNGDTLSFACLKRQVNAYLKLMRRGASVGSTDFVCPSPLTGYGGVSKGEWDVGLRVLMRLLVEARGNDLRYRRDASPRAELLDVDTWELVWNDLLPLDGPPGDTAYTVTSCANQENASGAPQDRIDDERFANTVLDDVGDALKALLDWLFRHVIRPAAAGALASALGPEAAAAAMTFASSAAVAEDASKTVKVPETENHLLMIESARFLTNQLVLEWDGGQRTDEHYAAHQSKVREWLLKRLQQIAKDDFVEYNSRPYARYSIPAIQNLYDFANLAPVRGIAAPDEALRAAAKAVLDLSAAKMAIGSLDGRRLIPLRRRMDAIIGSQNASIVAIDGTAAGPNGMFDLSNGVDFQAAAFVLYTGTSAQAPRAVPRDRDKCPDADANPESMKACADLVTLDAMRNMLPAAISGYLPPPALLRLARSDTAAVEQRLKHAGAEHYSRGPGFLISAGGRMAPPAYSVMLAPFFVPGGPAISGLAHSADDLGAALPTTLMLAAGTEQSTPEDMIRFEGNRQKFGDNLLSFDNNLCVSGGFACGLNLRVPAVLDDPICRSVVPAGSGTWRFIDTFSCFCPAGAPRFEVGGGTRDACHGVPHVFIAAFEQPASAEQQRELPDVVNAGLIEVVPQERFREASDPAAAFRQNVFANNTASAVLWPLASRPLQVGPRFGGTYTTADGHSIGFDAGLAMTVTTDSVITKSPASLKGTGIISIDGADEPELRNWKRAIGPMTSPESGLYEITVGLGCPVLHIDMRAWENPVVSGDGPCVP